MSVGCVPVDPEAQRVYEAEAVEARERELDAAVGRGAIRAADRETWRDRLRRNLISPGPRERSQRRERHGQQQQRVQGSVNSPHANVGRV
jgi:hypothetical protein